MPVIPELQGQKQENYFKFEASLHSNFQVSQGYTERLCLKQQKPKEIKESFVFRKQTETGLK